MHIPWLAVAPLFALPVGAQERAVDAYPADISPPPGTQYPCAQTALPRSLPGIPEGDRGYVNRTYTRILRATQAKLVALRALDTGNDVNTAVVRYLEQTSALLEQTRADAPPPGLAPFQDDVAQAIALQQEFFRKAVPLRASGRSMSDVYGIPEGPGCECD